MSGMWKKKIPIVSGVDLLSSSRVKVTTVIFLFIVLSVTLSITPVFMNVKYRSQVADYPVQSLPCKFKPGLNRFGEVCDPEMTIVTVACGNRLDEVVTIFQSITLLSDCDMTFVVLAEPHNLQIAQQYLNRIVASFHFRKPSIRVVVREAIYPDPVIDGVSWKDLYGPCSTIRLFFPKMFPKTDALIYLDSDTLAVSRIEHFWRVFKSMDTKQVAGLIPEHQHPDVGWYNVRSKVPYVPPLGVNSGVMLMNLTRMREWKWNKLVLSTYRKYEEELQFHDQDIINTIFHDYPEKLLILPCIWNFRTSIGHCNNTFGYHCPSAFEDGVPKILHGNSATMHTGLKDQEYLPIIYKAFRDFRDRQESDVFSGFLEPLKTALRDRNSSQPFCSPLDMALVAKLEEIITVTQNHVLPNSAIDADQPQNMFHK